MKFNRVKTYVAIPRDAITKKKLSNGMEIVVFKNSSVPKVLLQIAYDIGSNVEQSGERGLAHLIEHMIFKGTAELSEVDIDRIARHYGATFNAWTSYDATSYYFETNKNNWQPFIHILADCMQNSRFEEEHLASELKAVIQELRMYKDDYVRHMIFKALALALPAHHPYHSPVIGYKEDLLGIRSSQLRDFYHKYYSPDRATLFIVGDIDPEEVIRYAEDAFKDIPSKDRVPAKMIPQISKKVEALSMRVYEDVKNEVMLFYWLIPGLRDKRSMHALALESILGRGEGSRLHRLLVESKKVATSVSAQAICLMDAGVFAIVVEPVLGKNDKCRTLIQEELTTMMNKGVSDYELERMVKMNQKGFIYTLQSYSSFVYQWIQSRLAGDDEYGIFERSNKFNDIISMDIRQFITGELDPFLMNQIELLPIPETKKDVADAAKKESDEFDAHILKNHERTMKLEEPRASKNLDPAAMLEFVFPKPDRDIQLSNGLRVLLKKHGVWPIASMHCQFKDEWYLSQARQGIVLDLMMNMLQEGTTLYKKRDIIDFFDMHGGSFFAGKSGIHLAMMKSGMTECLERALHIMKHPIFPQDSLDLLKMIFVHDFESIQDVPRRVASRILKNAMYTSSDYAWTYDEAVKLIQSTTSTDLIELHRRYVNPANMTMSIVGDFDVNEMEKTIRELFESWPAGERKIIEPPQPSFTPQQRIDHHMMRDQIFLLMGQPSTVTLYDKEYVPLRLLSSICFHSLGSRIYRLREQTGLFYSAYGSFGAEASRHVGFDYMGAILSLDKIDDAEIMLQQMMHEISTNGITQQELDAARQLYLKDLIDVVSTNSDVAKMLCQLEVLDLGFDYYDRVLQEVQNMTVERMNELARSYIRTDLMTRIRVGRLK